jgi:hypothetical protein
MNGTSPLAVCEPERLGAYWTTVTIDKMTDDRVFLHVSILAGGDQPICGRDVQVSLRAGPKAQPLTALEFPAADQRLPEVRLRGRTAMAAYVFANPEQYGLEEAVVTIGKETHSFDLRKMSLSPRK